MSNYPKIYIFANGETPVGDLIGTAIAEDGTLLGQHYSTNAFYMKHDMGLSSENKHNFYRAHYPDGFEVVFVPDPSKNPGLLAALKRNQEATAGK
jgi:hypothetical protein